MGFEREWDEMKAVCIYRGILSAPRRWAGLGEIFDIKGHQYQRE